MKKNTFILFFFFTFFCFFPKVNALNNGVYVLKQFKNTNYVLSSNNTNINNSSNLVLKKNTNNIAQKFLITKEEDGLYSIKSVIDENYSFDVYGGNFTIGTNVGFYNYHGGNSQKWNIIEENNYYKICTYNGHYCIGNNFKLYPSNSTNVLKINLELYTTIEKTIEDGIYTINSLLDSNMNLDIIGGRYSNLTNIGLYHNNNGNAQKFYVKHLDDGFYSIRSFFDTTYSLDVDKASLSETTNIQLYKYHGGKSQQWIIKSNNDGSYNIISRCNYLVMDVQGGYSFDKANIDSYRLHNSKGQRFRFNKVVLDYEKTIDNGTYFINLSTNNNKVLDIYNANILSNSKVGTYDVNYSKAQKWYIEYMGNGEYKIVSDYDRNYSLDYDENGVLKLSYYNDIPPQKWHILKNNGSYYIVSMDGKYLDVGLGTNLWNKAYVNSFSESKYQKFNFTKTAEGISERVIEDGIYNIVSAIDPAKFLDVYGGLFNNGSNINLWEDNGGMAQKFKITYINDGYYKISPIGDLNKTLDVYGGYDYLGVNLELYEDNNSLNQQWIIKDAGDGYYYIVSNNSGMYLDIANASTNNGANIILWEGNNQANQKFKFKLTSFTDIVIDVSSYQGDIDWYKVKKSGIYGVILRVNDGINYNVLDSKFNYNIEQIKKYNIPYGLYTYSYAENYSEGAMYAGFVNNTIKQYNLYPTLGVYLDIEANSVTSYMGPNEYTNVVNGFLSIIPKANIYTYTNYANTALNTEYLRNLITWIADYRGYNGYSGKVKMWQFTSNGSIDGIPNAVDMSHFYP